ncbi:MAG: GTP 3',8-cyclase MoaA [Candidatus Omnitrophica bacterium CG11_big_fil_rev_8_21_14_0_20_42_13]|uniref:GTP 3',8-cyclase n=1 Tax=Candidatus Ghiorseimicrobium undicola TaxID=1974746 RepID=A0A2H0LXL8_9BACT|nr:MAG: GTP 3',8-cyclase MoaA [Candidatus Omnitrophica bacterium CG11_big_fil_rev_8_21_14_0_20_42_13]
MLQDNFGRKIDYLRLSVTDRCNLRCRYCMRKEGIGYLAQYEILTLKEIARIARVFARCGIVKIRLTGGEPLLRQDIAAIMRSIFDHGGIRDICLTTNGVLLKDKAASLKAAGLRKINISLDTLKRDRFAFISRGDFLNNVLSGVDEAVNAGFLVKLNVVAIKGVNDDEILDFVEFCQKKKIILRFIELMPVSANFNLGDCRYLSRRDIEKVLRTLGALTPQGQLGSGPADYYGMPGFLHPVGFISAMSGKFCFRCNRLRISAKGEIFPCLSSRRKINLRNYLRSGASDEELMALIKQSVADKPREHCLNQGENVLTSFMSVIGG